LSKPQHLTNCRRRNVGGLALLDAGLPLAEFLGRLALVPAEFGEQRDYSEVDAGHQLIGSPALVVPAQYPAGAAGRSAMSAPRCCEIRSRRARSRSQRFWRAATRALRLLISPAMVAAESATGWRRPDSLLGHETWRRGRYR